MTEKIQINGKDVWIVIDPHTELLPGGEKHEYFTVSYYSEEPGDDPGGILLLADDKTPLTFNSPVEALEFASEKLILII